MTRQDAIWAAYRAGQMTWDEVKDRMGETWLGREVIRYIGPFADRIGDPDLVGTVAAFDWPNGRMDVDLGDGVVWHNTRANQWFGDEPT